MTVRIGGIAATVQFAGIVGPGQYQFNVIVPSVLDGDHAVSVYGFHAGKQRPLLKASPSTT